MRRAAVALRSLAAAVGLEGAFLIAGTILLAVASSYLWSFGPWLVVGAACVVVGFVLARPARPDQW